MWFRRRNMGYAKCLKNGHMKVQVQKQKNDEHMKAHVLKKEERKIAMFQNNKLYRERDHILKRSIILVYLFSHRHILI
jgi:Zn ribbon nucleic-acid-binding protein